MNTRGAGDFLAQPTPLSRVFTPEDFSDEHRMVRQLAERFLREEVIPRENSIERQEWHTTTSLLKRCGELGLLGIEVPAEYGGEGLDKVSAMIVAQAFGPSGSFGVSYGGQAGLGALPLVYFGSEHLKRAYLPSLCRGEIFSAYALSEATSGSDALAAQTVATRNPGTGSWTLRGEKMWITNAAFADVFVTFAKVDGKDFTCFLVPKEAPGVSTGAEEHKMGLKGSSTRPLLLDNAQVPESNIIGEIGKGHHVAFNILNIGRAKIGAIAAGAANAALAECLRYARQRVAFGRPIASFGAIQQKLAEMAVRTWVVESMVYRTAGAIDDAISQVPAGESVVSALRQFAVACAVVKVFGSEVLDFVVDEAVQIFGGYGYSASYPVERYYRDARISRIFEGTNEINRLLIAGNLTKNPTPPLPANGGVPEEEYVAGARYLFYELSVLAREIFGEALRDKQELLMHLSDIAIEAYAMDSAVCRAQKSPTEWHRWIAATFVNDAIRRIRTSAENLIPVLSHRTPAVDVAALVRRYTAWSPYDTISDRRRIAAYLLDGAGS